MLKKEHSLGGPRPFGINAENRVLEKEHVTLRSVEREREIPYHVGQ